MNSLPENDLSPDLQALLTSAATYPLSHLGWISVRGEDRVRWLNGMVTNNVRDLASGDGCYNFLLSAQGRIQHDCNAFQLGDRILLQTSHEQVAPLMAALDHFIIMDDVELTDISAEWQGVGIAGPHAASVLAASGIDVAGLQPLQIKAVTFDSQPAYLVGSYSPLVPRYEIWTTGGVLPSLEAATAATPETLETLRILEGVPAVGKDIRDRELPQETNQTRALHFSKGCYLGQEIVERIRSRGNVHRTFTAFRISGAAPAPGTPITADGATVGELTSVDNRLSVALGFIRREAVERKQVLSAADAQVTAVEPPLRF